MAIPTKEQILEALQKVKDPEMNISLVDLGMIYDINIEPEGKVQVKMTLTTAACPNGEMLVAQVHKAVEETSGVTKTEIVLVWDPVWDPATMASDSAKDILGIW